MAFAFHILGTSSSGNCSLLEAGGTRVMLDAGFQGPRLEASLQKLGLDLTEQVQHRALHPALPFGATRRSRDRRTQEGMDDGGQEDERAGQQEAVRRQGGGKFLPEVGGGCHAPPHRKAAWLATPTERLLRDRDVGAGATERLHEVDLGGQAIEADAGDGDLRFGAQATGCSPVAAAYKGGTDAIRPVKPVAISPSEQPGHRGLQRGFQNGRFTMAQGESDFPQRFIRGILPGNGQQIGSPLRILARGQLKGAVGLFRLVEKLRLRQPSLKRGEHRTDVREPPFHRDLVFPVELLFTRLCGGIDENVPPAPDRLSPDQFQSHQHQHS